MKWIQVAALSGALVALCAGCSKARGPSSDWPAGSKVSGQVCFEHEFAGEWEALPLRLPNGATPVKGTAFTSAIVPVDAGAVRIRSCE